MSRGPWKNPSATPRAPRATVAKHAVTGAEPVSAPEPFPSAAPVTGAAAVNALQADLAVEAQATDAITGREAVQSMGAAIGQDEVLDNTLLELGSRVSQPLQLAAALLDAGTNGSDAVNARDTLMQQHLRKARMSPEAQANGELDPVSVWVKLNSQDDSRMLGADGRNLIKAEEVGQFISLDGPDGKPSVAAYNAAIARGARLVVGDDGKPVRNAFGVGVAWPVEVSAARLAAHNRLKYPREELDPTYQRRAMNRGGVLAVDVNPDTAATFLNNDVEDAWAGNTGRRPQLAENRFSRSVQKVPPELISV